MSEMTPETTDKDKTLAQKNAENPAQPGTDYAYIDQTKEFKEWEGPVTEASHAELNPAYYPRDTKPEALWNEAEQAGADSPGGHEMEAAAIKSQAAAGMVEVKTDEKTGKVTVEGGKPWVPLGPGTVVTEENDPTSEEAQKERDAEYEEMGKADLEAGQPAASTDPEKAVSADEAEKGEGKNKVKRNK